MTRLVEGNTQVLEGRIRGTIADPVRDSLKTEVKAATFHGIEILRVPHGLQVDVVFDL